MKKINLIPSAVLLCILLYPFVVEGVTDINDDFEGRGGLSWKYYGLTSADVKTVTEIGGKRTGVRSLEMRKSQENEWSFLWRHLNGKATWGDIIHVQAWVKSVEPRDCEAFVAVSVKNRKTSEYRCGSNQPAVPSTTWQKIETRFTIPSVNELADLNEMMIEVSFGLKGYACQGPVLFDDVKVEIEKPEGTRP